MDDDEVSTGEVETAVETPVTEVTEHIESVKDEVTETPKEDIDAEWRTSISQTLTEIQTEVREIKASRVESSPSESSRDTQEEVREIVVDPPPPMETEKKRRARLRSLRRSK